MGPSNDQVGWAGHHTVSPAAGCEERPRWQTYAVGPRTPSKLARLEGAAGLGADPHQPLVPGVHAVAPPLGQPPRRLALSATPSDGSSCPERSALSTHPPAAAASACAAPPPPPNTQDGAAGGSSHGDCEFFMYTFKVRALVWVDWCCGVLSEQTRSQLGTPSCRNGSPCPTRCLPAPRRWHRAPRGEARPQPPVHHETTHSPPPGGKPRGDVSLTTAAHCVLLPSLL
jgi:hypothetical protein